MGRLTVKERKKRLQKYPEKSWSVFLPTQSGSGTDNFSHIVPLLEKKFTTVTPLFHLGTLEIFKKIKQVDRRLPEANRLTDSQIKKATMLIASFFGKEQEWYNMYLNEQFTDIFMIDKKDHRKLLNTFYTTGNFMTKILLSAHGLAEGADPSNQRNS